MASQQAPARPRLPLASLPDPAPPRPSNQVLQARPSFVIRPTTFGQSFRLPITAPPPPPAAVAPPPLPATPAAAPRAAVVPFTHSSSYSSSVPQSPQPRVFSTPNSPLPNSHAPNLVSPSPTPSPPSSPFQTSLAVSITAPTTITTAPPTTPNSPPKINKSHLNNTPSQSPKTSPISQPPSPPSEIKKNHSDSKDFGAKVITLAGNNEGATMKLSFSREKGNSIEISDDKGNSNQNPGVGFVINSNVQGVNNSILCYSSLTHHSPGVHLSVNRKANDAAVVVVGLDLLAEAESLDCVDLLLPGFLNQLIKQVAKVR
ncbi:hypothetical protein LguiB_027994 [Lonicera macranthoides]